MKPTATTCIAISWEIPNREQAMGISRRDPPATPDAPQAARAERTDLSARAFGNTQDTRIIWVRS